MNWPACAIPLENQHARPLRIVRIVLDDDRRVESTDDLTHLDTVRREFIVSVSRHPYVAACHEHAHRVERLAQCLRAFMVVNLAVDLVYVSTHVRPGARKIFGLQSRIETQQIGFNRSKPPGLLQDPDRNPSTHDNGLTAADAVNGVDGRTCVGLIGAIRFLYSALRRLQK